MSKRKFNAMEGHLLAIREEDRVGANKRINVLRKEATELVATGNDPTGLARKTVHLRELFPCLGDTVTVPTTVEQGTSFGKRLGMSWLCRNRLSTEINKHRISIIAFFESLATPVAQAAVLRLSKFRRALRQSRWAFDLIQELRVCLDLRPLNPAVYGY